MSTITNTFTTTDVRRVFEMFASDLRMLAMRTQAMDVNYAASCAKDVEAMAREDCLRFIDVQLLDSRASLAKAHRYSLAEGAPRHSQRPGGNRWPCLPGGRLSVIVTFSDVNKANSVKDSGILELAWGPTVLSTDYSGMRCEDSRLYSSNSYGLHRESFSY